jgi:uncharacterized protein (DUF2062 family)
VHQECIAAVWNCADLHFAHAVLVTLLITAILASLVVAAFLRHAGQHAIPAHAVKKKTKKAPSRRSKRGAVPAPVINTSTPTDVLEEQ